MRGEVGRYVCAYVLVHTHVLDGFGGGAAWDGAGYKL